MDDDKDDDAEDGEDNVDGGEDGAGSGRGDDSGDSGENDDSDDNEKKKYHLRFVLKDDEQKSYSQTDYIAFLPEGTQLTGKQMNMVILRYFVSINRMVFISIYSWIITNGR
ncbi:hypothetical protein [Salmonella enterica]|uniref:hypothetical protein n=1 Tax=Salmonella enterica TaxID=28901 RepID=UPI001C45CB8C|nr:hypothetical protein [Salmonella enterica]